MAYEWELQNYESSLLQKCYSCMHGTLRVSNDSARLYSGSLTGCWITCATVSFSVENKNVILFNYKSIIEKKNHMAICNKSLSKGFFTQLSYRRSEQLCICSKFWLKQYRIKVILKMQLWPTSASISVTALMLLCICVKWCSIWGALNFVI